MVTISYEKVSFDKLSEAFKEHEKLKLSLLDGTGKNYNLANDNGVLAGFRTDRLYRKVETEITPMQRIRMCLSYF